MKENVHSDMLALGYIRQAGIPLNYSFSSINWTVIQIVSMARKLVELSTKEPVGYTKLAVYTKLLLEICPQVHRAEDMAFCRLK